MKHLLSIADLGAEGIEEVMRVNPTVTWITREAIDDVDLGVEVDTALTTHVARAPSDDARLIGSRVAAEICDGSTLQAGIGEVPDATIAGWFAATGAPFASEVCLRTPNDRKGGHLAVRRADGQLILRESAQTAPEDMDAFQDTTRHAYFNTNNLWLDLEQLKAVLAGRHGGHLRQRPGLLHEVEHGLDERHPRILQTRPGAPLLSPP